MTAVLGRGWVRAALALAVGSAGLLWLTSAVRQASPTGSGPYTREASIDDLRGVGSQKPMGYLAGCQLDAFGVGAQSIVEELEGRGLVTYWDHGSKWHGGGAGKWSGGPGSALFACDRATLQALLDGHRDVLRRSGWPEEATSFMRRVAEDSVRERDDRHLYRLIGLAFADPRFTDWS